MSSSNTLDPWLLPSVNKTVKLEFEDTFVKGNRPTFKPLDDSEFYLAILENKLRLLKSDKKKCGKNLVEEAEKTWNSYMHRLITSESREKLNVNQDPDLEQRVTPKLVHSWIQPEQALTIGELAELLKHDSVALNLQSEPSL